MSVRLDWENKNRSKLQFYFNPWYQTNSCREFHMFYMAIKIKYHRNENIYVKLKHGKVYSLWFHSKKHSIRLWSN